MLSLRGNRNLSSLGFSKQLSKTFLSFSFFCNSMPSVAAQPCMKWIPITRVPFCNTANFRTLWTRMVTHISDQAQAKSFKSTLNFQEFASTCTKSDSSSFHAGDLVDLKITQSNCQGAFQPISWEKVFGRNGICTRT